MLHKNLMSRNIENVKFDIDIKVGWMFRSY